MDTSTLQKISTLKNLPTLPHILLKLIDACNQDSGSLKEIASIAEKDPSLTVKILKIVNSTYYGLASKVENIDQAVALVGTNVIRNIAVCASIHEAFDNIKENKIFSLKRFWRHSLKCAVLARLVSKKIRHQRPDEAFLAGLLHDIGKLVLWVNFSEQYEALLDTNREQDKALLVAEKNLVADHCEIGAWLLNRWNFKPFMVDAVLYHHQPQDRIINALPLAQIVNVANAMAREPFESRDDVFALAQALFHFNIAEIEELLARSDQETEEAAHSLQIEIEPSKGPQAQVSEKDIEKQAELLKAVQDISALSGTLQNLLVAEDQNAILKVIQQGLQLLFDINNLIFFLYDSEKNCLTGKTVPSDTRFYEIQDQIIPLEMEESLLIACLRRRNLVNSFNPTDRRSLTILDMQLQRLLGNQGMVCVPMFNRQAHVGVMVIGLDSADFIHLSDHFKLLTLFAGQAALALQADYHRQSLIKTIQSERIGASSAIARKVCHEVNNPLGIIKNYLKILGVKLAKQGLEQDEIRIINEEIDRVAHILRGLSDFSTETLSVIEPVDINRLISDLAKLTRASLAKNANIQLHVDLASSVPAVMADKNGLKQVFINLIKNAMEAMPAGGRLSIQTRHKHTPFGQDAREPSREYRGYVEISFSDEGIGVPDEMKARLFEPYITTKGEGHAGLGLSIVYNIINALNGSIACESKKDKGTVFKIELPVIHTPAPDISSA